MKLSAASSLLAKSLLASLVLCAGTIARADEPAMAPAAPTAEENLPAAKDIYEKYLSAIGGKDKLKAITSRQMTMTVEVASAGMKGTVTMFQLPPAKAYSETELAGMGKFMQGSDGEIAWDSNPMSGARILTGKERDTFMRGMRFDSEWNYESQYKDMKTTKTEKLGDKTAYVVELTSNEGTKETRLFDKDSGLLLASRATATTQMGEIPTETLFDDYREVNGIKMSFKQTAKLMGNEMKTTVEKAEFNAEIPASKFELPADIKALKDKGDKEKADKPATDAPAEKK
jgi:hypothetical protein